MNPATAPPPLAPAALDLTELQPKLMAHAIAQLQHWLSDRPKAIHQQEAEDIVQEALLRAHQKHAQFDPAVCNLAGWVHGILNNVLKEHCRKLRRQPVQPPADHGDWDKLSMRMDPTLDTSELTVLLDRLSEESRRIATMHRIDGLSHQEIAAKLGISVGNSRVKVARVMSKLKQIANKEGGR